MYTNIPYICEGEIVQVQDSPNATKKNLVRYICMVDMPNGSQIIVPNCVASTMFGGIDDYLQVRSRTTKDNGNSFQPGQSDENNNARIGDRVYVSFVSGSIAKPVILAYAQHPNQSKEFENPAKDDTAMVMKYHGMRFDIDTKGVFRATHFGAPKIKYVESGGSGGAKAAISGLLKSGGLDAVTPRELDVKTYFEMKDLGGFEIRDALGQLVEMDTDSKRIYISTNDRPSTEEPGAISLPSPGSSAVDAEYITLDRDKEEIEIGSRGNITIVAQGDRFDETEGDHTIEVEGNYDITIVSDAFMVVEGDNTDTVKGKFVRDISGTYTETIGKSASYTYKSSLEIESSEASITGNSMVSIQNQAGAALVLDGGTIALGAGPVDVLQTLSDALEKISALAKAITAMTVPTGVGPSGPPINSADFIKLDTEVTALKTALDGII